MTRPRHIVVVGSLNADLVVNVARFPRPGETVLGSAFKQFPGGKGGNQAHAAAKLGGPSVAVSMIGQVGGDSHGAWLRDNLAAAGCDVDGVGVDPSVSSGMAFIQVDDGGQNQIVLVPGANGSFGAEAFAGHLGRFTSADAVLLQLEVPMDTVVAAARAARAAGAVVLLDPAPAQPLPDHLYPLIDWLTPNQSELVALAGAAGEAGARVLRDRGAHNVIVKMGAAGALVVTAAGATLVPAFNVTAVDTTAAGDVFNAAFAIALVEGQAPVDAAGFAAAAAAVSVTRRGAQPSLPTRAETLRMLHG